MCLHANNSRADVDRLVGAMVEWAESWAEAQGREKGGGEVVAVQAKL